METWQKLMNLEEQSVARRPLVLWAKTLSEHSPSETRFPASSSQLELDLQPLTAPISGRDETSCSGR